MSIEDAARAVVEAWDRKDYLKQPIERLRKALTAARKAPARPHQGYRLTKVESELEKYDAERGRD